MPNARLNALVGERTLMRIHILDADRYEGKPLASAIVGLLRERGFPGATAMNAIMGYGASRAIHSYRTEIASLCLPVVVECVDAEERITGILPELDAMVESGMITLERAQVLSYRATGHAEDQ